MIQDSETPERNKIPEVKGCAVVNPTDCKKADKVYCPKNDDPSLSWAAYGMASSLVLNYSCYAQTGFGKAILLHASTGLVCLLGAKIGMKAFRNFDAQVTNVGCRRDCLSSSCEKPQQIALPSLLAAAATAIAFVGVLTLGHRTFVVPKLKEIRETQRMNEAGWTPKRPLEVLTHKGRLYAAMPKMNVESV